MKYLIILILVLSSCGAKYPNQAPTLAEKQEYYHKNNKHPLKAKDIPKAAFWIPTICIMSFMYVRTMKSR